MDAFGAYLSAIRRIPLLSDAEERALAERARAGDVAAAQRLAEANLRFVVRVAAPFARYGIPLEDLVQEGNLGLLRAVQSFDPARGVRFVSYAVWWIRAAVEEFVLRSFSLVRIGTTQRQRRLFRQLPKVRARVTAERGPDPAALAKALRAPQAEVEEMEARMASRLPWDPAPIADPRPTPEDAVAEAEEQAERGKDVREALDHLGARERLVLEARDMDDDRSTLQQLSTRLGISRERVRQVELGAKRKVRARLEAHAH